MTLTPLQYAEHIATAFLASPDELCEPGEEGGDLYGVLVQACERFGLEPQSVIDGLLDRHGSVEVAREQIATVE